MDANFPQNRQYGRNFQNNRQQFAHTRELGMANPASMNPPNLAAEERSLYSEHRYSQGRNPGPNPHRYLHRDFGLDPSPMHERPVGARGPPPQPRGNQAGLDSRSVRNSRNPPSTTKPTHQTFGPDYNYQHRGPERNIPTFQRGNGEDVNRLGFHPREDAFQQQGLGEGGFRGQRAEDVYSRNNQFYGSQSRGWSGIQTGREPFNMTEGNNPGQTNPHGIQENLGSNLQYTENAGGNNFQLTNAVPSQSRNKKSQKCILTECHNSVSNMKEHMMKCHLPKIFNMNFLLDKPALHDLRMRALRELAISILGSKTSLEDLCSFLRNQSVLPQSSPIQDKADESMRAFCHHHGYIEPRIFDLHTINSPAVLLHWRALSSLLRYIPPAQQREFHSLFHAEGLEFEWDLMKNKRQQDQGVGKSNQTNIPSQSSTNQGTENNRFQFDVQMNLNRIQTQFLDSQPVSEFGKSQLNGKHSLFQDIKREQQVQEPSFHREDLPEKTMDQLMGLHSLYPLDGGTEKEDLQKTANPNKNTTGLTKSQIKRRRRVRAQKKQNQRMKKVQKRIMKNREARRIDRNIKKLNAHVGCPVPGCYAATNLKHHAFKVHLPKIFDLDLPVSNPDLHSMRWLTLRELTMYILGPDAQIEDLLQFMRTKNVMPQEATITHSLEVSMKALCQHQGLKIPHQFTMWPPNSPAILLHWRALLGLLQYVTPRFQQQFKSAFTKVAFDGLSLENVSNLGKKDLYLLKDELGNNHHREEDSIKDNAINNKGPIEFGNNFCNENVHGDSFSDDRRREYLSPHPQYDEQYHEQTEHFNVDRQNMVISDRLCDETFFPERPGLMDSHFYFDRLCMLFNMTEITPLDLLSNLAVHAQPRVPVDIIGGALVYSNPKYFSLDVFPNYSGWRNCFGVDALTAPSMQEQEFRAIGVLTNSADAAFGDIGLDRSAHKDLWMDQEVKFRQLLSLSTPSQPMILKITGPYGDPYGFDVSSRVRELVRRQCSPTQHIHLCNFKGEELMVREWLDDFSNCYFGFSRKVLGFDEQQVKGLQAVPDDRLLLESDISLTGVQQNIIENSPLFLGEVASAVATMRKDSLENIAHKTVSNTCRLYNL